jgi:hypothetical protein
MVEGGRWEAKTHREREREREREKKTRFEDAYVVKCER